MFRRKFKTGLTLILMGAALGGCDWFGSSSTPQAVPLCNSRTGLSRPLPACSTGEPCTNAVIFVEGGFLTDQTVNTASDPPACRTFGGAIDDGAPAAWEDSAGVTHYACVHKPIAASSASPRPLLIFFHGAGGNAGDVYNYTTLRIKAISFDLSGVPLRTGFILVSVQGRNILWRETYPSGRYHDHYYRDLASPSSNPDVAHVDHLIDELASQGIVDPGRIYTAGWSNGAMFAQTYAIARYDTPTPGGNRVAAAAVYAFGNPFANLSRDQTPSCELDPYPTSAVPLYLLNRACDALTACSTAQQTAFNLEPGFSAEEWVNLLDVLVGNPNVLFQRLDPLGLPVSVCAAPGPSACTLALGESEHLKWPNGVADSGPIDWELDMLGFLRDHPSG